MRNNKRGIIRSYNIERGNLLCMGYKTTVWIPCMCVRVCVLVNKAIGWKYVGASLWHFLERHLGQSHPHAYGHGA